MTSGSCKKLLVSNYSQTSTYGHLSTMAASPQWQLIFVLADSPYNASYLNLSIMATSRKWLNNQFFQWLMEKSGMVMKFDSYGPLMINHGKHILIVYHLYCCSKYILSKVNSYWQILIADLSTIYFVCLSVAFNTGTLSFLLPSFFLFLLVFFLFLCVCVCFV